MVKFILKAVFYLSFLLFPFSLVFGQDTLSICSFNIQFLGHFQNRENAILADVLKKHDIVVIQEMVAPPVEGMYPNGEFYKKDKESADFVEEMENRGFSYWISNEDTGPSNNHTPTTASEWWVVFYKKEMVSIDSSRFYGFISEPLTVHPIYQRVPFAFPFIAVSDNSNFTLISVHLKPGDSKVEKEIRQQELVELFQWINTPSETNKDFYVLGDCNIYNQSEFNGFCASNIYSLNAQCENTNTKLYESSSKGKPYDHVFYTSFSKEDILENSFEVIDLRNEIMKCKPNQFILEPYDHDYFRTRFSDHLPISFKIVTGKDTD